VQRKTPAKHKAKNSKDDDDEPIIYPKLEDEIFNEVSKHAIQKLVVSTVDANKIVLLQLSSWSFTFPIRSEQSPQQEVSYILSFNALCSLELCNCRLVLLSLEYYKSLFGFA
jgi:hypothetical protein